MEAAECTSATTEGDRAFAYLRRRASAVLVRLAARPAETREEVLATIMAFGPTASTAPANSMKVLGSRSCTIVKNLRGPLSAIAIQPVLA
jgi:hypothetical protein